MPIEGTKFSDNYFDLFPGQERVIEVCNEAGRWLEESDIAVGCLLHGLGGSTAKKGRIPQRAHI